MFVVLLLAAIQKGYLSPPKVVRAIFPRARPKQPQEEKEVEELAMRRPGVSGVSDRRLGSFQT